jgi:ElaB/YqjD/DUF883 family membrane-anchored ribosome-binding protein
MRKILSLSMWAWPVNFWHDPCLINFMETTTNSFPNTRRDAENLKNTAVEAVKDLKDTASTHLGRAKDDVSNLKDTAVDAAQDLKSTASGHVQKAKQQLGDLATHAREEGGAQLEQVKGQFADVVSAAREYVSTRPLGSIGVALAVGFLFGLTRRSR